MPLFRMRKNTQPLFRSRLHLGQAFLGPLFIVSFVLGLSGLIVWVGLRERDFGMEAFGVLFGLLGCYMVYYYLRFFFRLVLYPDHILRKGLFERREILYDQIKNIQLGIKAPESFLWATQDTEAAVVHPKQGQPLVIFLKYYQNNARLQQLLAALAQKNRSKTPFTLPSRSPVVSTVNWPAGLSYREYHGNLFLTLNFWLILFILGCGLIPLWNDSANPSPYLLIPFTIVGLMAWWLHGQLHYFRLGKGHFAVRRHGWPGMRTYRTEDIREIVFEQPYRRSSTLRVITTDFRSRTFGAGSLSHKKWRQLRKELKGAGIKVRGRVG